MSATPTGAVNAIRAARAWPAFAASRRTNFWINALLTVVAAAASYGAALGQAGFAELYLGMRGPERYVVFLIIEATAVALMLLANQTALAGDSAAGLWALVWAVTAGAVTMQVVHARAIGQPEAAMVYATASVLTVLLWRAKTRRSLRDRLRAAGMIEDPLPRYRPIRWLLRPRETFQAWYLALGEGVSDPATAMDMARADRLYHRAAATAQRAARNARRDRQPTPDLTDQQHVVPPWRITHPDAHRFGVLPWHRHTPAAIEAPEPAAPQQQSSPTADPQTAGGSAPVAAGSSPIRPVAAARDSAALTLPPVAVSARPSSAGPADRPPTQVNGSAVLDVEPISAPPTIMPPEVRAQLQELLPAEPPVNAAASLKALTLEALDSQIDPEDPRRPGEIAEVLAEQFGVTDPSTVTTISRYVRQWRAEVSEGRRDPARNRRRTVAGRIAM